jgi:transcriptional regulator with XRE-family HTH domain
MTQGERVKELRKTLGLTLEKFGEKIGVGKSTISDIENNRRTITDHMAKSICREFNVNEEWLRNGYGEMCIPDSNDELDALARKYNLSAGMKAFIDKFAKLDPKIQDVILEFILELAHELGGVDTDKVACDDTEAQVEDFRRQLELEKKAGGESEASQDVIS